jgi:hypothetical protein
MPERPFADSLCHQCVHKRDVVTARSWFLRCTAIPSKYAPQPVLACPLFAAATRAPET